MHKLTKKQISDIWDIINYESKPGAISAAQLGSAGAQILEKELKRVIQLLKDCYQELGIVRCLLHEMCWKSPESEDLFLAEDLEEYFKERKDE